MKSRLRPLCVLVLSLVFTQWGHAVGYSETNYGIRISQAWLQMPDGVRLAVDLFIPEGAAQNQRFPVLLEYLPYRKDGVQSEKLLVVFLLRAARLRGGAGGHSRHR
jgi:predicted acyl esterase